MQVVATSDFTAVREHQTLKFREGDIITGDLAAYLLRTGAAVEERSDPPPEGEAATDKPKRGRPARADAT